ncbi:MAG: hypothetical protein MHM6MM_006856 [Cercozoa sp. M6MM]
MSSFSVDPEQSQTELLFAGFNQDFGCFACGTDTGFRIFNCEPFKNTFRRDFPNGGIGHVEMLFRCNILALVGGGANPRFPPNKVMIWDDQQGCAIGELSFRKEVKAVRLRRDRVVVVLEDKIYVYNFADLTLLDHVPTIANPYGLCALCPYSHNNVLVCPGLQRGHVRVELYNQRRTSLITAHESNLACLALNFDGTRLATASEKGTLIRIFDTESGDCLQELRRGLENARITSLAFDSQSRFLACSSDRGTVHVFKTSAKVRQSASLRPDSEDASQQEESRGNTRHSLGFMRSVLPKYFSSEWSFAQFRVPTSKSVVAFAPDNKLVIVTSDGAFYKVSFDPVDGGECECDEYARFIVKADEEQLQD